MQSQHLFEAPFVSEVNSSSCSKGINAEKCMCRSCQGKILLRSNLNDETKWLFEAPHSSDSTTESYLDAMVLPFRSRQLSPTNIAQLTTQIEARMKALGIPVKYIGIKGIPGANGRGFDPNMTDPGGFVRTRGMAVGAGVLKNMPGWGAWNKASLPTRIDAVIAHEWVRLNKGAGHQKARDQAPNTLLPISDAARQLLLNQKNRGAPEIAKEYGGEANEGVFRPIRSISPWPRLLNQATQAIRKAITHLKSPPNLQSFDNALISAEYLLHQAATEIQKVIKDSPSVPRQFRVIDHLRNASTRIDSARKQARETPIVEGGRSIINPATSLKLAVGQIQLAQQAIGLKLIGK